MCYRDSTIFKSVAAENETFSEKIQCWFSQIFAKLCLNQTPDPMANPDFCVAGCCNFHLFLWSHSWTLYIHYIQQPKLQLALMVHFLGIALRLLGPKNGKDRAEFILVVQDLSSPGQLTKHLNFSACALQTFDNPLKHISSVPRTEGKQLVMRNGW